MANILTAEVREAKNPREMRRNGAVPAVVYGKGFHKEISINKPELDKLLAKITRSSLIALQLDGEEHGTYIKDIQYHPLNDKILHIDLFKPADGQTIKMVVPIRFNGEPIGRKEGGIVNRSIDAIAVKGTTDLIPDIIDIDISNMQLGDNMHAKDVELPEGAELLTLSDVLLVQVIIPRRAAVEGEEGEEGAEETAEGAVPAAAGGTEASAEEGEAKA
jgi:large subunit ribosomal protein L25